MSNLSESVRCDITFPLGFRWFSKRVCRGVTSELFFKTFHHLRASPRGWEWINCPPFSNSISLTEGFIGSMLWTSCNSIKLPPGPLVLFISRAFATHQGSRPFRRLLVSRRFGALSTHRNSVHYALIKLIDACEIHTRFIYVKFGAQQAQKALFMAIVCLACIDREAVPRNLNKSFELRVIILLTRTRKSENNNWGQIRSDNLH